MRSVFDLVATVPEAKGSGNAGGLGGGQGGAFGATLDGISVNTNRAADTVETAFLTPSVEAITEFAVETNGFKPEFGQAAGGAITFASKSGTNAFHGRSTISPQRRAGPEGIFRGAERDLPAEQFRRVAGAGRCSLAALQRQEPDLLLRGLRRFPEPPGVECADPERADAGNVQRRLLELGGQQGPEDHRSTIRRPRVPIPTAPGSFAIRSPATSFRPARFSAVAKQYIALAKSALVPESGGARSRHLRLRVEQLSVARRHDGGNDQEVQREDRPRPQQHAARVVPLQPGERPAAAGDSGPAGLPVPFNEFRSISFDADLHRRPGTGFGRTIVNHLTFGVNTFNKDAYSPNVGRNWKSKVCITTRWIAT